MTWATTRGHARGLDIPKRARSDLITQIEDDHRRALVRTLLHDDSHAIEDRVAGLLMLLYGQPLARIARLTRNQITFTQAQAQLLPGRRHGHAAVGRTDNHRWVFPGGAPAQPISTSRLRVRLAALGIHSRSGRNTALMDLAAKVPPVTLARLLSIHINTAGDWADRAGGSQAAYAAQVSRRAFSKI